MLTRIKNLLSKFSSKGFTLIELLIVIAILGILAAGILVAIDPVEQLSRGRDAGRKSAVTQLGRALQAYYTANSNYPVIAGWNTTLINSWNSYSVYCRMGKSSCFTVYNSSANIDSLFSKCLDTYSRV